MNEITRHKDYQKNVDKWELIDDICDGENLDSYILTLNPADTTDANKTRNAQYRERAVFYDIAGSTARGMVGMPFRKWPKLQVPALLDYAKTNIDGRGTSIYQQSQAVVNSVARKGRAGLLVDYPEMEGEASQEDLEKRRVYAITKRYEPETIIDWYEETDGATVRLSMVKLHDSVSVEGEDRERLITYRMIANMCTYVEKLKNKDNGEWEVQKEAIPTDGKGRPLNFIPFTFVGSTSNTPTVDNPPMYNMCKMNIGHYRNSADYEDSVHYVGQVQPWMSGGDETFFEQQRNSGMYIGSRMLLPVPEGGAVGYLQAQPNMVVKEAMGHKVEMMVGLGAMFINPGSAVKTATQVEGEQQVQHSILSLICSNVSEAYTQCLVWMSLFMDTDDDVEYTIQQDFVPKSADAQMVQALIAGFMQNAIPYSDLAKWLQANSIIDPEKTLEEIKDEIGAAPTMPDLDAIDNNQTMEE